MSGFLALLLAGLGVLVRSESAHDAFHRHDQQPAHSHDHAHHGHGHVHHHDHGHHSHGPAPAGRHEHTSPLIDLLAEELLLAASTLPPNLARPLAWEGNLGERPAELSLRFYLVQPPGRAPPLRSFA